MAKISAALQALLLLAASGLAVSFTSPSQPVAFSTISRGQPLFESTAEAEVDDDAPRMNPDNPNLPEIKGDYNWDEKFKDDADWIIEDVPGKVVLNDVQLAAQVTALSKLEEKWRKERLQTEYDEARLLGWTSQAETYNGRFAMFFLVVGLLTEYWTGVTIPGQIEEMLRVGGFIGPDY
uniref:High light inducible protein n=1 Tax=Helicotheca tamesis TaxID=374047 RepID=A0A7S2MZX0_9STRA|mmetsp:Transcript_6940/g.9360  ORF Transcript_6940/g.9360 Transcript_6940/m.9360 type:complete len:179 (+) Transcript_6940:214-750(+)|eukprot:CAMPEP_0185728890 /NCGR_PEP_ID=MMETSP1171-20130828/4296_1 /TAXON_ID=374046 /ORGANISM="Helicotheca tamensis, Strain CCMP826" /LENGTH=178 /DNA_ID=CAMNT_0028397641 /DNA_START=131 /DNA_END=667 /DNA_ORIENTATION=+